MFCRVFQIRLSSPQLAALMTVFDKDNDGTINCAEFLLRFFLVGFKVRGPNWRLDSLWCAQGAAKKVRTVYDTEGEHSTAFKL